MFSAPNITLPLCFLSEVIQMEKGEYISSLDDEKRLFVVVSSFAMIQARVGACI